MNNKPGMTWEEAVQDLKSRDDLQALVRLCYYDEPLLSAAERFAKSEEWQAVCTILKGWLPGRVMDLGAGHGISSYAWALQGCRVFALDPDPSEVVGVKAIRRLGLEGKRPINVIRGRAECLPLAGESVDVVYGREVLHHVADLGKMCQEAARVLRPGGVFLATREHIISRKGDLPSFFRSHPLHHLYGGENALLLSEILQALNDSGLVLKKAYGPYETVINFYPLSQSEYCQRIARAAGKFVGGVWAQRIASVPKVQNSVGRYLSWRDHTPGRLYSFLAEKPNSR